jgi:hypothetical protein
MTSCAAATLQRTRSIRLSKSRPIAGATASASSQILTKSLITTLQLEVITDEGFLNNPYRSYRYVNPTDDRLFALAREIYPRTRTSNAVAVNARYFLPYRAAIHGGYRFFTDTWGIGANTFELGYTHPWREWTFDVRLTLLLAEQRRLLRDLFDRPNQQNFLARDKELSTFKSQALEHRRDLRLPAERLALPQEGHAESVLRPHPVRLRRLPPTRASRSCRRRTRTPSGGTEPLYSFGANVIQMFVSVGSETPTPLALALLLISGTAAADPFPARDLNPLLAGFGLPAALASAPVG